MVRKQGIETTKTHVPVLASARQTLAQSTQHLLIERPELLATTLFSPDRLEIGHAVSAGEAVRLVQTDRQKGGGRRRPQVFLQGHGNRRRCEIRSFRMTTQVCRCQD